MPVLGAEIRQVRLKQGCPLAELDLSISEIHIVEAISQPFEVQIILSGDREPNSINTSKLIGSDASVSVGGLHWHGMVRSFGYVSADPHRASNVNHYRAVIVPKLWKLSLSSNNRLFAQLSVANIVAKLFSEHGLRSPKNSSVLDSPPREICTQYGETDLDFLNRLCAEEGICYRFEHSAAASDLMFLRAPEAGVVNLEEVRVKDLSFQASLHSGQVRHYDFDDMKHQVEEVGVKSTSVYADDKACINTFGFSQFAYDNNGNGQHGIIAESGKSYAINLIRHLESSANGTSCEFRIGSLDPIEKRGLNIGRAIKGIWAVDELSEVKTVVTRIELTVSENYESGYFEEASVRCAQAVDYYCEAVPPKPRPRGPMTGIVTELRASESEAGTDPGRRIKVKFPWEGGTDSCWLRVVQGYAGNGWGASFVPRPGQEVLVDFLNGDIDRPVVVGALYNGKNIGPAYTSTQSGFKTESKKFNELRFDDKAGAEEVYLEAGRDLNYLVHNNTTGVVEKDYNFTVKGERSDTVEKDFKTTVNGQLTTTVQKTRKDVSTDAHAIESNKSIELKVGGCSIKIDTSGITIDAMGNTIKLEASGISVKGTTLKMNSNSTAELKATASVSVEGSAMAELKSSGMTTIKGSMTMIN